MNRTFSTEFVYQVFSLVISIIIVHSVYVTLIRPTQPLFSGLADLSSLQRNLL